ncbi:hypothetical protein Q4595_24430, partial [Wenyingzhuangia sp. 1_MG-2023]|nr:hypothetical protein [Wenyingzhuangia sp. 1_MG-2023]
YSIGAVAEQGTDTIPTPEAEAAARAQFVEVEQQLDTVPYEAVADLIEPLQGYSLYPYLQYQVYQRFPEHLTQAEVNRFLDSYPQFPRRIYLQNTWLKQLAK